MTGVFHLGAVRKILNYFTRSPTQTVSKHELIVERGNGFYSWNRQLYKSDIVRSCIRPFARSIGKLSAKQIREAKDSLVVNPDRYIKMLLEEPNPLLTGQMLLQKMAVQYQLNNNAFALIIRDDFGFAEQIYPISASSVEAVYDSDMKPYLRFCLQSGTIATFPYSDIIHVKDDFCNNDLFGESNIEVLAPVMEVVGTLDKSLIDAVKNGAIIRWLIKWSASLRPEDLKEKARAFAKSYLDTAEEGLGVAATDAKAELTQVTPHDYVPNAVTQQNIYRRLYNYFHTNEKIINSTCDENEWNSYYELVIEPFALQLANEFTRKIFSLRERGHGNRIVFESMSLQYASMSTKLNLLQMVDRGAMTPNEWRKVMNMAPIEGGDKPIRRLDTAVVKEGGGENM